MYQKTGPSPVDCEMAHRCCKKNGTTKRLPVSGPFRPQNATQTHLQKNFEVAQKPPSGKEPVRQRQSFARGRS